jgi:3-hydroxyacyl-CoA dehydrogenase/enoyl-CoA hydratase/carnithine racemase
VFATASPLCASAWAWAWRSSGRTSLPDTEFKLAAVETARGRVALVTVDNGEDYTKPTFFGRAALESLERLLPELEDGDWAALVLTGKPFVFAAGADITEFPNATRELAVAGSRAGHELFSRIRALPFPTVAAINGACLGGGVELALHCDARTISTAVRHFACPECFLGILPAWGGTQLLPRLVGAEMAVKFVVANPMRQNRMLSGPEAFELGFADRLLEPAEFVDESLAFALELPERAERPPEDAAEVLRKARARLDGQVHGAAPAPYVALDLIEGALSGWSLEHGYAAEEEAVGELLPGPPAQASLYAFDLVDRRAKSAPGKPEVEPRPIRKVGLVGAGLMAAQLATLFLRRLEVPVAMRDVSDEVLASARETIDEALAEQIAKGRFDEGKARFLASLVSTSTGYEHFADCDLVLEAVFEEVEVKQQVFRELREHVRDDCVLATNTSSLSVEEIGADVGIHFFNPVAVLPLVELVRTPQTDDETLATAWAFADRLRKRPVLVADAPAFVVNRVLTRLMSVVLDALEHGTDPDEADDAILRLGLPMAPSVLLQMVGPRVANHVLETLHAAYPDRFSLSQTLANYADGRDEIAVRADDPWSQDGILDGALEALADEIHHLLDEGVVADAKDVDTALLLGAGWPFWLGGITKHLDQSGISERMFGRPLAEVGAGARA